MIVISGALVLIALVLLVIGILDTNLLFVFFSIGASVVSLLSLVVGVVQRRKEALPEEPRSDEATAPQAADEPTALGADRHDDPVRSDELAAVVAQVPEASPAAYAGSRRVQPAGPDLSHDVPDSDLPEGERAEDDLPEGEPAAYQPSAAFPAHGDPTDGRYGDASDAADPPDTGQADEDDDRGPDEDDDEDDVDRGLDEDDDGRTWTGPALSPSEPTVLVVDGRPRYHLGECRFLIGKQAQVLGVHDARTLGFSPCGVCKPDSVLEQPEPEPDDQVEHEPEVEGEVEVEGPGAEQDRAGGAAADDGEPGLSFEELLFGEPVFGSPRDEGHATPVEPSATQERASDDDDTRALELPAFDPVDGSDDDLERSGDAAPAAAGVDLPWPPDDGPAPVAAEDGHERGPASASGALVPHEHGVDESLTVESTSRAEGEWREADVLRLPTGEQPSFAEHAPVGEAVTETAPADGALTDPAPAVEASADRPPSTDAPAGDAPTTAGDSQQALPAETSLTETSPTETSLTETSGLEAASSEAPASAAPAKRAPARQAPAQKAPAKKAPAKKAPAKKAPARKPAADAPAKKAPSAKAPTRRTPAEEPAVLDVPGAVADARVAPRRAQAVSAVKAPSKRAPAAAAAGGPVRTPSVTTRAAAPKLPPGSLRAPGRPGVVVAARVVGARPAGTPTGGAPASRAGEVVVIPDGGKFHRSTCRFVRDVPEARPLSAARAVDEGYAPCGVCRP